MGGGNRVTKFVIFVPFFGLLVGIWKNFVPTLVIDVKSQILDK